MLLILATLAFAGDSAGPVLAKGRDLLQKYWPILLAGLALLAGVFVTVLGITGLASSGHGTAGTLSRRIRRADPLSHAAGVRDLGSWLALAMAAESSDAGAPGRVCRGRATAVLVGHAPVA